MSTDYTHQIVDIGWEGDNASNLKPYVMIRSILSRDSAPTKLYPGHLFNWQISEDKYCPGDLRELCPFDNKIDYKYERCPYCEKKIGFKAAFLFGAEPNERMKEHLAQEHYIYLAYFPPDIIKVGTAAGSRKLIRLIEQDALLAMFVATNTGFNIQNLEHAISSSLGITEMVKSRQKYQFIKYIVDKDKAREMIISSWQRVNDKFKDSEYKDWLLEIEPTSDIIDLTVVPTLLVPEIDSEIVRIRRPNIVTGEFVGLRGKFLLLRKEENILALKISSLLGRKLLATNEILEYDLPKQEQLGLF